MAWSRVSNAADMSRAARIVIFPESIVFHDVVREFANVSQMVRLSCTNRPQVIEFGCKV